MPSRRRARRRYFNPRVPCGTRLDVLATYSAAIGFQPTRPLRDATLERRLFYIRQFISTHASLAGRDASWVRRRYSPLHFNPRVPCGTRPRFRLLSASRRNFNPRVPCGTRLRLNLNRFKTRLISTHASLAGRDRTQSWFKRNRTYFNPRVPCGTRLERAAALIDHVAISTHASLAGRDNMCSD